MQNKEIETDALHMSSILYFISKSKNLILKLKNKLVKNCAEFHNSKICRINHALPHRARIYNLILGLGESTNI